MPRDVCIVDIAQKRSVCTIFGPWIAKTEMLVSEPCQLLISSQVGYPLSRIALWGPSS